MKRLLNKTWAKLTAFFLTIIFAAMTVLAGVGVGFLVNYNVFLDGGTYLREELYESQCNNAIYSAYYYLRDLMVNAGALADDTSGTDDSTTPDADTTPEELQQVTNDLAGAFASGFPREDTACHLAVANKDTGEITFENFELTDSDKPLYSAQETFSFTFADGHTEEFAIIADLLRADTTDNSFYLVSEWLLAHTGLTVFLAALFLLLPAAAYGIGYLQGPAQRERINTGIKIGVSKKQRKQQREKKARKKAGAKTPERLI